MMKPHPDDTVASFQERRHHIIKQLTIGQNVCVGQKIQRKVWGYMGHVLRGDDQALQNIVKWRDDQWWHRQPRNLFPHRRSGWQLKYHFDRISLFLMEHGYENEIAEELERLVKSFDLDPHLTLTADIKLDRYRNKCHNFLAEPRNNST